MNLNTKLILGGCLFEAVKLCKNYGYIGYAIGFDTSSNFSINGE